MPPLFVPSVASVFDALFVVALWNFSIFERSSTLGFEHEYMMQAKDVRTAAAPKVVRMIEGFRIVKVLINLIISYMHPRK